VAKLKSVELWGQVIEQSKEGWWNWDVGGVLYRYRKGPGLNFEQRLGNGDYRGLLHFPELHDAYYWSKGFEAGVATMAKYHGPPTHDVFDDVRE